MATAVRPSLTLYDTSEAMQIVSEMLWESDGVVTPEIEALLGEAEEAFKFKAERVALFIRGELATAKVIKEEEERLASLRKRHETRAESLKGYLQRHMELTGIQKVEGTLVNLRLQKNNPAVKCDYGQPLLAMLYSTTPALVAVVPESYTLDKAAVKDAWKRGEELPEGITVEQSTGLRIS